MLPIGVVARQTGIDISTLRKWEARYGFPRPVRAGSGQRKYPVGDVETLLRISRRIAAGERVGRVMRELLAGGTPPAIVSTASANGSESLQLLDAALVAVRDCDLPALRLLLEKMRWQGTMLEFVEKFAAPLTVAVGDSWARGDVSVYAEHLYSTQIESILAREVGEPTLYREPVVLLTTLAGEKHTLGLSMIHAVLGEAGVPCLRLSSDLPTTEIVKACEINRFRAVGVSVSANYPPRLLRSDIFELREHLDGDVALWLGGGGVGCLRQLPRGARVFESLHELTDTALALPPPHGVRIAGTKGN